jgi:uncharacterized protein (DUF2249 family)
MDLCPRHDVVFDIVSKLNHGEILACLDNAQDSRTHLQINTEQELD